MGDFYGKLLTANELDSLELDVKYDVKAVVNCFNNFKPGVWYTLRKTPNSTIIIDEVAEISLGLSANKFMLADV